MDKLGNIVLIQNIKINGKKVRNQKCVIIAEDYGKCFMLPVSSTNEVNKYDHIKLKDNFISLDKLIIIEDDKSKNILDRLDENEYMRLLYNLNNYQLIKGNYPGSFFSIKNNIQKQIIEFNDKMIKRR